MTSVESEMNITERNLSLASAPIAKVSKLGKYINNDIADKVLKTYKTSVLPGEKLTYEGVNVLNSAYSVMKGMKKTEMTKSPLCIHVINFHNLNCTRYLPHNYNNYIANQLQDCDNEAVNFDSEKKIDKFIVDCKEVLNYLDKFYEVNDLESLGKCLDEHQVKISTASNDLIYVQNLFHHFFFLYKNDFLIQNIYATQIPNV